MTTLPADLEALMPEPECYQNFYDEGIAYSGDPEGHTSIALFTADQMREAIRGATERAAKVVEQVGPQDGSLALVTAGFSAAIRSGGEGGL